MGGIIKVVESCLDFSGHYKLAGYLDDIVDAYDVFDRCGTAQGIAAVALWWMVFTMSTTLMILAITLGGIAGFILGALVAYSLATLLNAVFEGITRRCR